ncbi:antibiotic biosynthesis monooxygenase family protein [Pseudobythopirellula maris]|uniref:antibiotic biosynthesis monooxygenase family protein n=1 Tax=Pseudobythopirellula maris TaxID=2527991 RepID=UPI0018D2C188|nr:antibiotic biosynthesis monooxygenase family protein [Pseudobythopirellula maris]
MNVFVTAKPGFRDRFIEAGRSLFEELAKQPTFIDARLHASADEPDLVVVYERWNETKESFIANILPNPCYQPYLKLLEESGVDRKIFWLTPQGEWDSQE